MVYHYSYNNGIYQPVIKSRNIEYRPQNTSLNNQSARDEYELSDEEVSLIDSQYAEPPTEKIFDLILSDLYEVPDDDDEFEEAIV